MNIYFTSLSVKKKYSILNPESVYMLFFYKIMSIIKSAILSQKKKIDEDVLSYCIIDAEIIYSLFVTMTKD